MLNKISSFLETKEFTSFTGRINRLKIPKLILKKNNTKQYVETHFCGTKSNQCDKGIRKDKGIDRINHLKRNA